MKVHWYLVMSQKTIKVYTYDKRNKVLHEILNFDNPLGRERNRVLIRKQSGLQQFSTGHGAVIRHSADKRTDPHVEASFQFAQKVVRYLEREFQNKSFESLTVAAEPSFLGKFKSFMKPPLKNAVNRWITKDLIKTPQKKLLGFLVPQTRTSKSTKTPIHEDFNQMRVL